MPNLFGLKEISRNRQLVADAVSVLADDFVVKEKAVAASDLAAIRVYRLALLGLPSYVSVSMKARP
jgi:hypothetical protein